MTEFVADGKHFPVYCRRVGYRFRLGLRFRFRLRLALVLGLGLGLGFGFWLGFRLRLVLVLGLQFWLGFRLRVQARARLGHPVRVLARVQARLRFRREFGRRGGYSRINKNRIGEDCVEVTTVGQVMGVPGSGSGAERPYGESVEFRGYTGLGSLAQFGLESGEARIQ